MTIIPNFFLMKRFGLIDSYWPLILLPVFGPHSIVATFLTRQYFLALPRELEEAGRMDGLSRFGVWWRVARGAANVAARARGGGDHHVSPFLEPFSRAVDLRVFGGEIYAAAGSVQLHGPLRHALWHLQLAATSLAVVPVLIVYLIAQRQIIESFALSGVKG